MDTVTYLLGAGCSYGVVPLADEIAGSLRKLGEDLPRYYGLDANDPNVIKLSEDLFEIGFEAAKHRTIDTYAKKLCVLKRLSPDYKHQFNKVKNVISAYFMLEEAMNRGKCNARYDGFWAALLDDKTGNLPRNLNILSWNYDSQIELSFKEYCLPRTVSEAKEILGLFNNFRNYPLENGIIKDEFGIFKLNGSAHISGNYTNSNQAHNLVLMNDVFDYTYDYDATSIELTRNFEKIVDLYSDLCNPSKKTFSSISFAWENIDKPYTFTRSFIDDVRNKIADTSVLVIIGYSFPYFNRSIDRALFQSLSLRKVYVQDPSAESVITAFNSMGLKKVSIEHIRDYDRQFFLPPEL